MQDAPFRLVPTGHPTGRLRAALPGPCAAFLGAFLWGLVTAASASLNLAYWVDGSRVAAIAMLFALGGALAFPAALFLARLVALHFEPGRRFAVLFLALGLATVGITALVFALQHAGYSAVWNAQSSSHPWWMELFFTLASTLYQFAVLGLRLYFPYGLVALFAFGLWFAAGRVDSSPPSATPRAASFTGQANA